MNNTRKNDKRNNVELSKKNGTVANAIVTNLDAINEMCLSSVSVEEVRAFVIETITNNSKSCASQKKIIANIAKMTSKQNILSYAYDMVLKGDGLGVLVA